MALLQDRVAIVTGGAGGIGRAVVEAYVAQGARVVLVDPGVAADGASPDPEVAAQVARAVDPSGTRVLARSQPADSEDAARRIVDETVAAFGGLDILVHCAGISRDRAFVLAGDDDLDAHLEASLRSAWRLSRASVGHMIDRGGGVILACAGLAGVQGAYARAAESAAQGAVLGWVRALATELRRHEIRVHALVPHARTRTTRDRPGFPESSESTLGPRFVAPVAVFLASDHAKDLRGEVVSVAGNRVAAHRTVETAGVIGAVPTEPWTPEALAERWREITRPGR